ncbi:hypothetical protein DWU89_10030 [Parabacteroides acidifaciens]|uniref:Uncharacterized protein n=1 Tax=Parabacteroides acidifaciens TaxID=2290935 RepID=A0A3D8HFC2_9BACT|nr:hypothetical protein DWU89_10030 [Parabacteroides acidifaciens]
MAEGRGYCTFPHFYIIFPFFFVYFISAAFFWDNRDCLPLYDPTSSAGTGTFIRIKMQSINTFIRIKMYYQRTFIQIKQKRIYFFILSLLVNSYFK